MATDEAAYAMAAAALDADPVAGWTVEQFDRWCQEKRQSLCEPDTEHHAHQKLLEGFVLIHGQTLRQQAKRKRQTLRQQAKRKLEAASTGTLSAGDRSMIMAQVMQLLNNGVAAMCLRNKEARAEQGLSGTSDGVAAFAAIMGFIFVSVAVADIARTYRAEKMKTKQDEARLLAETQDLIEAAEQAQARAQDRLDRSEQALAVLVRAESTGIEDGVIKPLKAAAQRLAADARDEVQQQQSAETTDAIGLAKEDAQRVNQQLDEQHALSNARYAAKVADKRRARNRTEGDFSRSAKAATAKAAATHQPAVPGGTAARIVEAARDEEAAARDQLAAMRTTSSVRYANKVADKRLSRGRTIGDFARRAGVPAERSRCHDSLRWLKSKCSCRCKKKNAVEVIGDGAEDADDEPAEETVAPAVRWSSEPGGDSKAAWS